MTETSTKNGSRSPADTFVAAGMFFLSLVFLVLVAGLLYSHQAHNIPDQHTANASGEEPLSLTKWDTIELRIQLYGLGILWPVFIAEAVWTVLTRRRLASRTRTIGWLVLIVIAPPTRIAGRITDRDIWLPRLGWRRIDKDLRRRLERFFSVPMIVIALMVLPLLAIEFGWRAQVEAYPALRLVLELGNSLIWLAFAVEFLVMISVADKKLRYCALHWVDLAIILLPVFYVLIYKILPLLQTAPQAEPLVKYLPVLRLSQLGRMGRVYRMQGLALKAWRAFLVLEIIQRVLGRPLEKQLQQLEELLVAKEEEVAELRREVTDLKKRIAVAKDANTAQLAAPQASAVSDAPSRN